MDDIQTIATFTSALQNQTIVIKQFTSDNLLNIKTEIVKFSKIQFKEETIDLKDQSITTIQEAKCLGVW